MNNKSVIIGLTLLLTSGTLSQASFFTSRITKVGTIIRQGSFLWNGRRIDWINNTKHPQVLKSDKKTIDLSNFKGPFWIQHAVGNIEVREDSFPRLEIEKRVQCSSGLDDVDVDVVQVHPERCTNIKTEFKGSLQNSSFVGEGIHYTLFLPPFDENKPLNNQHIAFLLVLCGSVKIRHSGIFGPIGTRQGSIDISGAQLSPSEMNLKTGRGSIRAKNIKGSITAYTASGKIEAHNIDGNVDTKSSHGSIHVTDVNGNVKANTANGKIVAQNIKGETLIVAENGTISLDNVQEHSAYSCNGKIYRDEIRVDV